MNGIKRVVTVYLFAVGLTAALCSSAQADVSVIRRHPVLKGPVSVYINDDQIPSDRKELFENVRYVMQQSEKQVTSAVKQAASKVKYANDAVGEYDHIVNCLARLYSLTKEEKFAERAAVILYQMAEGTKELFSIKLGFFNPGHSVSESIYGYDLIYSSSVWKQLEREKKCDVRAVVENMYRRQARILMRELNGKVINNMMPHAIQRISGTALVLKDPELLRETLPFADRLLSLSNFSADGMYKDNSYSYQEQVLNHTVVYIENMNSFRDPENYIDYTYGLHLDGSYDFTTRWPLYGIARKLRRTMKYPDGRPVNISDTNFRAKPAPELLPELCSNLEFPYFGHMAITRGKGTALMQAHINFAPYGGGPPYGCGDHRHSDDLALSLFAAKQNVLCDSGYPSHSIPYKLRYFHRSYWGHNTTRGWFFRDHSKHLVENYFNCGSSELNNGATLTAYDDGICNGKKIQLIEVSVPGVPPFGLKERSRLLLLVAADSERSYLVDISRLKGGDMHEWYLLESEEEDYELKINVPLQDNGGKNAAEVLGITHAKAVNLREEAPLNYDYYYDWDLLKDTKTACGSQPISLLLRGHKSGASMRIFMNGVSNSTFCVSRYDKIWNVPHAGPYNAAAVKYGKHILRNTFVERNQRTVFGAVYDVWASDSTPCINKVDWWQPDSNGVVRLTVNTAGFSDTIMVGTCRGAHKLNDHISAGIAVVRRMHSDLRPHSIYTYGSAEVSMPGFNFNSDSLERRILGIEHCRNGSSESSISVEGLLPDNMSIAGQWVYVVFADGTGVAYKAISSRSAGDKTIVSVEQDPAFDLDINHVGKTKIVYNNVGHKIQINGTSIMFIPAVQYKCTER